MSSSLTEDYLLWLAPQIRDETDGLSHPDREFGDILAIMFGKPFVWLESVPNDDNRLMDGLELRREFVQEHRIRRSNRVVRAFLDKEYPEPPASFLEVLIGLSRRLAFIEGGNAPGWAYILMANLTLHRMVDPLSRRSARKASDILDRCISRTYTPDGRGGFFPLERPQEDQREVELWYQMMAYVNELPRGNRWG